MAAAMPWVVFHVPVGAAPALAGGTGPGTALAQAPFGRAVDGIGWSMSGSLVVPALPATPPAEKHRDIIHYTAVDGDTLRALASKYGLSVNTLLWSNPKLVDRLIAGQEVVIPPVDGVLVKVGATDTLASLAQKYRAESGHHRLQLAASSGNIARRRVLDVALRRWSRAGLRSAAQRADGHGRQALLVRHAGVLLRRRKLSLRTVHLVRQHPTTRTLGR